MVSNLGLKPGLQQPGHLGTLPAPYLECFTEAAWSWVPAVSATPGACRRSRLGLPPAP